MSRRLTDSQRRTLGELERRLASIAVLPSVVSRLSALDADSPTFAEEVTHLARSDPPFALRLIRLANQVARPGGGVSVDSIPTAIFRVGARALAELVLTHSVIEVFVPRTRAQRHLWVHSIQVAATTRVLARLTPEWGVSPEQGYLAGLLHDIGRFVLFEHRPEDLGRVDEMDADSPQSLIEAEVAVCGFDHAELGWHVCKHWSLPEVVTALVKNHHTYHDAEECVPREVETMLRLVQRADSLSFCLLRDPVLWQRPQSEITAAIATAWRSQAGAAAALQPDRMASHLREIEHETNVAANIVGLRS